MGFAGEGAIVEGRRMNEPVIVPPRRSLTRRQRVKLFDLRKGVCGICQIKIQVGEPWIDEHMNPREISADDSLDNHWPLHVGAPARPKAYYDGAVTVCGRHRAASTTGTTPTRTQCSTTGTLPAVHAVKKSEGADRGGR